MSFTVIYDANVLYPMGLRDLLVRIGQTHLVRARWTEEIMSEWSRALVRRRPDLETRIQGTVRLMNEAIRDVLAPATRPSSRTCRFPTLTIATSSRPPSGPGRRPS